MNTFSPSSRRLHSFRLALLFALVASDIFAQGSLTPPAAPAPTMKTLDQIRSTGIAINAVNTPPSGNAQFVISQPGSYYLTGNLSVSSGDGIRVSAPDVTIDMNGFEISGTNGNGTGVDVDSTAHNCKVRNGSFKSLEYAVSTFTVAGQAHGGELINLSATSCVNGFFAVPNSYLEAVSAIDNSNSAITVPAGCVLVNCNASGTLNMSGAGSSGNGIFVVGKGATLRNCVASGNEGWGILVQGVSGAVIEGCTAVGNTRAGITAASGAVVVNCTSRENAGGGIAVGAGVLIRSCVANSNTGGSGITTTDNSFVEDSVAVNNPQSGIETGDRCIVRRNTTHLNVGDGIRVASSSLVAENNCVSNGNNGDGAGIHASGAGNTISDNSVRSNDRGIDVDVAGNVVIRNRASANTTNFDMAANNVYGEIVDRTAPASAAVTGNSAPSTTGTTDPQANIVY